MKKEILTFKIDGLTPETLPMLRLAAYMVELAQLFSNAERVHFEKVKKGSAVLQAWIEPQAAPKVQSRLQSADSPDAPPDIAKAFRTLNRMLREDDSTGALRKGTATIIKFPGKKAPLAQTFRVHEAGVLDGIVIRVGGIDESVPIWIQDQQGTVHKNCHTRNRSTAKELARHYLGPIIRLTGAAKSVRNQEGEWELEEFTVDTFDVLDAAPLAEAVETIRGMKGNAWNDYDDPLAELKDIREGS
jgi:hypothetical protein